MIGAERGFSDTRNGVLRWDMHLTWCFILEGAAAVAHGQKAGMHATDAKRLMTCPQLFMSTQAPSVAYLVFMEPTFLALAL